jgi:hypothetical protein
MQELTGKIQYTHFQKTTVFLLKYDGNCGQDSEIPCKMQLFYGKIMHFKLEGLY